MAMSGSPDQARLASLRAEHAELDAELESLRQFMNSMSHLAAAVDNPGVESETLTLLESVLDNAIRAIGARDGSLLAPDERTGELVFVLVRGESPNLDLIGRRIPTGAGVAGWVARHRRATIVNNAPIDERFYSDVDVETAYQTSSLLAAPLVGGQQLLGVVEVINKSDGGLFSMGNQTLLTLMCRFAGELLYAMIKDVDLTQTLRMTSAPDTAGGDEG